MFSITLSTLWTLHFILLQSGDFFANCLVGSTDTRWYFPFLSGHYLVLSCLYFLLLCGIKSKAANPRLALLFNDVSLFSSSCDCSCCFLPQKCSQFCSLEHNYSKYLSPSSSTPRLLDFAKQSSCSWRWLKHNLKKVLKDSILAWKCKRKRGSKYFAGPPSLYDAQVLKTSGAFFTAQATCKPEGHLTPRHTDLNPFLSYIVRKIILLFQCSPWHELDVSSAFLFQTWTTQHEIILLDDCLGWGGLVVIILNVAAKVISPISSNEAAISEIRHILMKEMNGSQKCFGKCFMHALKYQLPLICGKI